MRSFKFPALRAEGQVIHTKGKLEIEVHESNEDWSLRMGKLEGQLVVSLICLPGKLFDCMKVITRIEPLFDSEDWEETLKDLIQEWGNH